MMNNETVRRELISFLEESGIKMKFIAKKLGWAYVNMSAFKNGKRDYGSDRLSELHSFIKQYK
jgi:hypothetical protein